MEVLGFEMGEFGVGAVGCLLVGSDGLLEVMGLGLGGGEGLLQVVVLLLERVEGIAGSLEFEFQVIELASLFVKSRIKLVESPLQLLPARERSIQLCLKLSHLLPHYYIVTIETLNLLLEEKVVST